MVELDAPLRIDFDYAVETIDVTTGEIRESYHYDDYNKAYDRFERVKDKDTLILLSLYTEIHRVIQPIDTHKLVLARNK